MMEFKDWQGKAVVDRNGNKVGSIGQLYVDDRNESPAWATVKTGMFGSKENFFPVSMAHVHGEEIVIDIPADEVKNAPKVDADEHLSYDEEQELYQYYQQKWSDDNNATDDSTTADNQQDTTANADSDMQNSDYAEAGIADDTASNDTADNATDNAMTRSEERLNVSKERQEVGKVRLKKYIVHDHVQTTVPVEREEIRLEREPITDENRDAAMNGPRLNPSEHEVTLHAEKPVVEKETVPVERVRLNKETIQDEEKVERSVKKEQIGLQGDDDKKPKNL